MRTKQYSLLLLALLISLIVAPSVSALNMSVSDLGLSGPQDIQIYSSGILQGTYNTTSDAIPIPTSDFMVVVKPQIKTENPLTILVNVLTWLTDNLVVVVFGFGIVVVVFSRW